MRRSAAIWWVIVGAAAVFAVAAVSAHGGIGWFEADVFHTVNDLPEAFDWPLVVIMQLGALGVGLTAAALTLLAGHRRRALVIALSVGITWLTVPS